MADLAPRSIECDGLLMGPGTDIIVSKIIGGGKPAQNVGDVQRGREDGGYFGVDRLEGRLLKFEVSIDTTSYEACQRLWSELSTVWDAERVRKTPAAVLPLRVRQFDGPTRIVFGRPNRIDPVDEEMMNLGRLDIQMDFRCGDHLTYSDVEHTHVTEIVPPAVSGFIPPLFTPLVFDAAVAGSKPGIFVGGDVAAYMATTIYGPVDRPGAEYSGQWTATLNENLPAQSQYVIIDSQPWSRRVRRNDVAAISGKLTQDSPYLSEMRVSPGGHDTVLRGVDPTGTARMVSTWRDAFLTL